MSTGELDFSDMSFDPEGLDSPVDTDPTTAVEPGLDAFDFDTDTFGPEDLMAEGDEEPVPTTPVSVQVEDTFLGLISRGQSDKILELTQPDRSSSIAADHRDQFASLYYRALAENPSLALYQKTLSEGISIKTKEDAEDQLTLEFPKHVSILQFTDKLGNLMSGDSVIVDALSAARSAAIASASSATSFSDRVSIQDGKEETDASISSLLFDDHQIPDALEDIPGDPLGVLEESTPPVNLGISLQDYSNKMIAEYLHENEADKSIDQLNEALKDEGFASSRISEIVAILKFLKTNSSIEAKMKSISDRPPVEEFKAPGF